jgi:hypothetical protein
VFASGTIDWVGFMDVNCRPDNCAGRVLGKVMVNLFSAFGAGPAGAAHPSNPAQSTVPSRPPVSSTTPATGGATGSP